MSEESAKAFTRSVQPYRNDVCMNKITKDELIKIFGERMPIDAVTLLFPKEPHGMTTDELRIKLLEIALKGQRNDR